MDKEKSINEKQTLKDSKVLFEEYKKNVLDGYAFVTYPSDMEKEAIEFLKQNKDKNTNALYHYGCLILNDKIKTSNDYKDAFEIMYKLSLDNNIFAQFKLGLCYGLGQGTKKDIKEAFKWYKKSAEKGHVYARTILASCYENGKGVKKNYNQAFNWYKKAAYQ